jgi:hypothetical protein
MNPVLKLLINLPIINISGESLSIGGIVGGFMGLFVCYRSCYCDSANIKKTLQKMKIHRISDKSCLSSFAKVNEKQRNPQPNASCFILAFAQPHQDRSTVNYFCNLPI